MLKFTINMENLKPIIDKVSAVIDKKTRISALRRCYFHITDHQTLRIYATDFSHFLEMECDDVWGTECGRIGIDIDDLKIITKMLGEVTVTETLMNKKPAATIKNHGKYVTLPVLFEDGLDMPQMDHEDQVMSLDSFWLLETLLNLSCFTLDDKANQLAGSICLNTRAKRAEALDGHHAGIRKMPEDVFVHWEGELKLPHQSFSVLKMILDKTPGKDVLISRNGKYIKIIGPGFTYMTREVEGKFFNIDRSLKDALCNVPYRITAGRKELIKIIQYVNSLIKKGRITLILHKSNDHLFSYANTGQCEILDEVSSGQAKLPEGLFIGFYPSPLLDILKVLDSEIIELYVANEKSLAYVKENEYEFLICPGIIKTEDKERIEKLITTDFA